MSRKPRAADTRRRGRPPGTSRAAILDCALQLLREEGSAGFSLRRLAARLGVSGPSLYNYFPDKQALLQALAELALGAPDATTLKGGWQQRLRHCLDQLRQQLLHHPELLPLLNQALPVERVLALVEHLAAPIREAGIAPGAAARHAQSLLWMTLAFTDFEVRSRQPEIADRFRAVDEHRALLRHLDLDRHDRLWRETVERNIRGLGVG